MAVFSFVRGHGSSVSGTVASAVVVEIDPGFGPAQVTRDLDAWSERYVDEASTGNVRRPAKSPGGSGIGGGSCDRPAGSGAPHQSRRGIVDPGDATCSGPKSARSSGLRSKLENDVEAFSRSLS